MLILALTCQHVFLRFHSKCQLQRFCHLLRRTDSPWNANGNPEARVEVWQQQQLKWMLCLHAYVIVPVTVLTCPCHLRWKSPPLCILPGRQCHSTMYKHEKAHQGNWGFNNQRLGARRDQWFQMEVQGQREGGRRKGGSNHSAASVLSGAANESRMLRECVPAGQILVVLQHSPRQGSHAAAQTTVPLCSLCPNERFNFKIRAQHGFHLLLALHGRKTSLEAEYVCLGAMTKG